MCFFYGISKCKINRSNYVTFSHRYVAHGASDRLASSKASLFIQRKGLSLIYGLRFHNRPLNFIACKTKTRGPHLRIINGRGPMDFRSQRQIFVSSHFSSLSFKQTSGPRRINPLLGGCHNKRWTVGEKCSQSKAHRRAATERFVNATLRNSLTEKEMDHFYFFF